jgi:hypothetical protein
MYNVLFGVDSSAGLVLKLLGKTQGDFGRFRTAYITEDHLVVHTRCGGDNRDDYDEVFEEMSQHPLFEYDQDDDFDCTYCDFYFKHPAEMSVELKQYAKDNPTVTPAEKWQRLITSLEKGLEKK